MERREHGMVDGHVRTNDEATSIGFIAENSPRCRRLESRQRQVLGHGSRREEAGDVRLNGDQLLAEA